MARRDEAVSVYSVEEKLERKFHEKLGKAGSIFGVDITTRLSKEALIGIIIIAGEQEERMRKFQEVDASMLSLISGALHGGVENKCEH